MGEVIPILKAYHARMDEYKRRGDTVRLLHLIGVLSRIGGSRTWMQNTYVAAVRPSEHHPAPWTRVVIYPGTHAVRASNGRVVGNYLSLDQANDLIKLAQE